MLKKSELRSAQERAAALLSKAGIAVTEHERANIEVAEFGLGAGRLPEGPVERRGALGRVGQDGGLREAVRVQPRPSKMNVTASQLPEALISHPPAQTALVASAKTLPPAASSRAWAAVMVPALVTLPLPELTRIPSPKAAPTLG